MNIFVFDADLKKSAQYFFSCDQQRARKQIVESTQMIAIAADFFGLPQLYKFTGAPYKVTAHRLHPCAKWVRESLANLLWTVDYTLELCTEYAKISDKPQACHVTLLNWLKLAAGWLSKNVDDLTKVEPQFFGASAYMYNVSSSKDVYEKYRTYLSNKLLGD
jgi:hypothetical protein